MAATAAHVAIRNVRSRLFSSEAKLSPSTLATIAGALRDARADKSKSLPLDLVPDMQKMTINDAYRTQKLAYPTSNAIAGAKCGATNEKGMSAFGIKEPFRGLIPSGCVISASSDPESVLQVTAAQLKGSVLRGGEAEWCFLLKDYCNDDDAKISWEKICSGESEVTEDVILRDIVADVFPAVEICGSRMTGFVEAGVELTTGMKIADGAGNGLVVIADTYQIGDNLDLNEKISKLAELTVTSKVEGSLRTVGSGAEVYSHPLKSLTWLVNHLLKCGESDTLLMLAGKHVMTGTCTGLDGFKEGEIFEAIFEGYAGSIKVQVVP
mmetsp:Transcript_12077/g.19330  ORF Transcript_12077/g.19330 Transcript_12077/m.19330 type:complete len:324 (+) Transcript_12077:58-1029(+)